MNYHLQLEDGLTPFLTRLTTDKLRGRFIGRMLREWDAGTQEIVGLAIRTGFTGKGPFPASQHKLGVVTGRLRRSIRSTRPVVGSDGAITTTAGSNVSYFSIHEFGFKGTVHVRGHVRRAAGQNQFARRGKRTKLTKASVEKQKNNRGYSMVRPHGRKLNIPARAPLGTVINSEKARGIMRKRISRGLKAASDDLLKS